MSNVKASQHQIGINAVAAQNFTLTAEMGDGTLQLQRGVPGEYLQLLAEWDANGFGSVLTPDLFDNTQKIATAEFVQRALGNHQASQLLSSASVMGAAAFGKSFWAAGNTPYDISLPSLSVSPPYGGGVIEIFCSNPAGVIVKVTGTDNIVVSSTSLTQFALKQGQSLKLVSNVANGVYYATGEAQLPYSPLFGAALTGNGWQKLPSGFIIQWGGVPQVPAGGYTDVAYPIPFPSAVAWTGVTAGNIGCLNSISSAGAGNFKLNFRVYNNLPGTATTGSGFYISVGY